jgi:hypothetical protein
MSARLLGTIALAAVTSGCIGNVFEPELGPPRDDRCVNEDSDPDVDVRYQRDIVEVIYEREDTGCFVCHLPDAPMPFGFEVGGLDLTDRSTLAAGGEVSGQSVVVAGAPCESALYQKVTAGPPFGARMPLNGPPFLSEAEMLLIHDWIAEGAEDN